MTSNCDTQNWRWQRRKWNLETSRSIQNDVRGAVPLSQVRKLKLAVERGELEVAQAKKRGKRAEVEVDLREADLSVIDDQLRHLHVESPISGVVLEVNRSAGEWIEKGDPIATIGRIDRLHVHALLNSETNFASGLSWAARQCSLDRSKRRC